MKIRLRFRGSTKVFVIEQDREGTFAISDVKQGASQLFLTTFDENYALSLNGKTVIEDETSLLSSCDIVSGDLLHIISKTEPLAEPAPLKRPALVTSSVVSSTHHSTQKKRVEEHVLSSDTDTDAQKMEIDQPGPSSVYNTIAGTSADEKYDQEHPVDIDIVNQCLREPILCREATEGRVPPLLRDVYAAVQPASECEAMSVVLHVLMMETGFIVHPEPITGHQCVPDKWKYPGYYKFIYTYPGCVDITVSLTVIPTGNSLAVHGKVCGDNAATRMCSIRPADYVENLSSDCAKCYCQLSRLNIVFKDSVASHLVQDIRAAAGLEEMFGFMALTFELKLRILSFLDVQSLVRMSQTSSQMADITKDPHLWRRLYLKTFGNRRDNSLSQEWKKLYMQEYKARKERRKLMSKMMMVPPLVPTRSPFNNTAPWLPPNPGGIIGGDYDLYPTCPGNLPGMPGRFGQPPVMLPGPRFDLIGPPGVNPNPDPNLLPVRPGSGRGFGIRPNPFGGGVFGRNFF